MTKKKVTKKVAVEQPETSSINEKIEKVVYTEPAIPEKVEDPKNDWEIKDRVYYLKGRKKPLTYAMRSSNIYYFDEKLGYERELKYTSNQKTPFVDEMQGDQRLEHIVFENGALFVPRNKTVLQKLLSLYHPHRDKLFFEYKPVEEAVDEIAYLEMEVEALDLARSIDIDLAEAIMRVELGSRVNKMSSKELKRDLLLYARRNPALFLELATDDNVQLRNFAIKSVEAGIISLSSDQRTFSWASNNRKLMTVPFDEHPYSALASWFKTDEGMEVYKSVEKRLSM